MRSRALRVRDVMKWMGVVNFCKRPWMTSGQLAALFPISMGTYQPGSTVGCLFCCISILSSRATSSCWFRASPPMSKVMSSTPVMSFFYFIFLYTSRDCSNANPSITFCAVVTPPFFTLVHDNIFGVHITIWIFRSLLATI